MADRRKYQRFRASLPLHIVSEEGGVFDTTTEDVGEGGLAFMLTHQLEPGLRITGVIKLSTVKPAGSVLFQCRVVRSESAAGENRVKMAAVIEV